MTAFQNPGRSAVYGDTHMAATSHPAASAAAYSILEAGGNAVDAALAANTVLCVAEPHMTGIGGDCFVLYAPAGGGVVALNGSGRSAQGASAASLRDQGVSEIADTNAHAMTVPGAVDAWCRLHGDYGTLPLEQLLAPAITLAENGSIITPRVAYDWQSCHEKLSDSASARGVFLNDGEPFKAGDRFANPALGKTLGRIAKEGRSAFYEGEVAEEIVGLLNNLGGTHTLDDFANQTSDYVDPISTTYKSHEIFECPPNGQGIIALMILNILEQFNGDYSEADHVHLLAEATKLAYGHRDFYLADPAKAAVPIDMLLSQGTARQIAVDIDMNQSQPHTPYKEVEHKDTIYLCVVDKDGNAISFINSLFNFFGSTLFAKGSGALLHSRGTGFSLEEGHFNELMPGKRPLHTIIPGMVMKDDKVVAPFGVMGGQYQATGHANFISRVLDRGMDLQEALDQPRSFAYGGPLGLEAGYDEAMVVEMTARGHQVIRPPSPFGGGQVVWIDRKRGVLIGASDPRKDGFAIGR
ncbi:MAG: gamma-glutamyltransferase [Rhodospirillaceae bacterium]|jgi:gamma-glutamyltranspeptidase / glutathione hydrolase|nr:gamma-glutamyltransferase [Rhodospirillaceae bacterium]MBT5244723.1 gamma-glutamyltransferase [Rhodospirillaceae bacterium]MBT5562464.1 gamma-glutamyltransferase [Rhodospirillaceae bacterium]MBT6242102.1 gamma-glutamyltransferase [Rhodospirillaceae bacterium]MBT7136507.1 gamma-glutamyltransferase [Rhodospirillaceae bacterium]